MKRILIVMAIFVAPILASGQELNEVEMVDGERAARHYLSEEVTYYTGDFSFRRTYASGSWERVTGQFVLSPARDSWQVAALSIDGVTIIDEDDKPLPGLPQNKVGQTANFAIWVTGRTKTGAEHLFGSFQKDILVAGDAIKIELHPSFEQYFIPYSPPDDVNSRDLYLQNSNNIATWSYDQRAGGFYLWLNPLEVLEYEIFDASTGHILSRGTYDWAAKDPVEETQDHLLSFSHQGAQEVVEEDGWSTFVSQTFDSTVERLGETIPAKVYMTRLAGEQLSVYVYGVEAVDFYHPARLEIRAWSPQGELPLIAAAEIVSDDYREGLQVQVPEGYDRIIITITGQLQNGNGFTAYFQRGNPKG